MTIQNYLLNHLPHSPTLKYIHHNNTYTKCLIKNAGDQIRTFNPGGERGVLTVLIETRATNQMKITITLAPPKPEDAPFTAIRESILDLTKISSEKRNNGIFISLVNLGTYKNIDSQQDFDQAINAIESLIKWLQTDGKTLKATVKNNIVTDWPQVFSLLQSSIASPIIPPASTPNHVTYEHGQRVLILDKHTIGLCENQISDALFRGINQHDPNIDLLINQMSLLNLTSHPFMYDTVSIAPPNTTDLSYQEQVALSIWYHYRLITRYNPSIILLRGSDTYSAYVNALVPLLNWELPIVIELPAVPTNSNALREMASHFRAQQPIHLTPQSTPFLKLNSSWQLVPHPSHS